MYRHSLVLGKFLPFHMGHKYLIDSALSQSDKVTLLVCTLETEPIDGNLRYDWIRRTYLDDSRLNIVHITENLPQEPKDNNDIIFWNIWTNLIMRECPTIGAVFTSEPYGDEIVKWLDKLHNKTIKHVCVDLKRHTVPISGTEMRKDVYNNWYHLPKVARPYFVKRICIIGAESVGKSTIVKKLAKWYDCPYVEEYGREYTKTYGAEVVTTQDISNIAAQQAYNEEQFAYASENGLMICDTNLIVTELFSNIYNGHCPLWVKEYNRTQKYDLYLLLNNDVPFVDDGIRQFEKIRDVHFNIIRNELYKRNENYVIIEGSDYDERVTQAVTEIDKLLK